MTGSLPLWTNLILFIVAAAIDWFNGTRMVLYGNALAERSDLTRKFFGLFILAAITELLKSLRL